MNPKFHDWLPKCRTILEGNQINSEGYRYTRPAPHVYEQQWLWDSCFHAITYRWFDVEYAKDELLSVVAKQVKSGADTGMIPHMNYWSGGGTELWGVEDRSIITQPPLVAVAALLVHEQAQDLNWLAALYPAIAEYHRWFNRRRDPDGDDLVTLIHAWEPGSDFTPRWDEPMGLNNPTLEESRAARKAYVKHLIEHDCDAATLTEAGYFSVEAADYNAIRAADLESLAKIADLLGHADEAIQWQQKALTVQQTVRVKCVLPDGIFDLQGRDDRPIKQESTAPFLLLFGGCADEPLAAQIVETLQAPRFWTPYPIPNVPTTHPRFEPNIYWRGNVWMSVNWLVYTGLRRYGYHALAHELMERSVALVGSHGFHEYFNPLTGEGYGPAQQSWTTVILDMLATDHD